MDTKLIKQKILDLAIRGKLVPQNPADEPASILLERIKAEKAQLIKEGKIKKEKPLPPIEEVPFEIPESWEWCRLSDFGNWQSGGTPSRSNKSYYEGSIPWLKTGDLNDGFITKIPESISEEAVANSSAKLNPENSVLIAMYGATIGKVGILTFPATTNQACCACSYYQPVEMLYLFYFLLSQKKAFIAKGGGGAQPNISKEIIVKTEFPLPPIAEQKRIVAEIDRWFKWIDELEKNQQDLHTAIQQAKSKILDLAIRGKLVPQESEWKEYSLDDVCAFFSGYSFSSNDYKSSGTPLVRISNIKNTGVSLEQCVYIQNDVEEKYLINKGDLLIAMSGATTGKMGIYELKTVAALNQRVGNLRVKDYTLLLPEYRNVYMLGQQELILKLAYGGAQPNISAKMISSFIIPLPCIDEQKRIVSKIEELFTQLDKIEESLN